MGIAVFPAASAGGIKSVQRGSAGGAGSVTITAVDITKSFVNIYGTASSGTVAAAGTIGATTVTNSVHWGRKTTGGSSSGNMEHRFAEGGIQNTLSASNTYAGWGMPSTTDNIAATSITGGSNNLVAAVVQGFLADSTTLTVSGACRWEVVEFA